MRYDFNDFIPQNYALINLNTKDKSLNGLFVTYWESESTNLKSLNIVYALPNLP